VNPDLKLAERAARAAGEVLLGYYGREPEGLDSKSSATDMVSDADRQAERAIRELLEAERPQDGMLAEESSESFGDSGRRWIVDPLDGTINFLYGFPAWAVSIALEDRDGLAVGVVHSPVHGETFCAVRDEGARLGGARLRVRKNHGLARAMVATGFSYEAQRRAEQAEVMLRLLPLVRDIRRAGAAALDLCMVAAGRVDAYYERDLKPWDWAAGSLIVTEAGGTLVELEGEPTGLLAASPGIAEDLAALTA
jgi:myo-inositol-1(or 4)-monophosphatase